MNRLGTLFDQSLFVLAVIAVWSNQTVQEIVTFEWNCFKNCLVLQFIANHLGSRKSAKINSYRLLVFAPIVFLFLMCILVQIIYTWRTISIITAYIGLLSLIGDAKDFLTSKISVLKYTAIIKTPLVQKPMVCGNESLCFFYCPGDLH